MIAEFFGQGLLVPLDTTTREGGWGVFKRGVGGAFRSQIGHELGKTDQHRAKLEHVRLVEIG